nr:hypothetical protein Iba_chr04bCG1470 [Ipomoea batatas]
MQLTLYGELCSRCLNSSQSAPISLKAKKSFGAIFANISLKPTEFASALLLLLTEASGVREPISMKMESRQRSGAVNGYAMMRQPASDEVWRSPMWRLSLSFKSRNKRPKSNCPASWPQPQRAPTAALSSVFVLWIAEPELQGDQDLTMCVAAS